MIAKQPGTRKVQMMPRRLLAAGLAGLALAVPSHAFGFTTAQLDSTTAANRPVGKLFVDHPDGTTGQCSAAVVDAPNRSTILTAGHCLSTVAKGTITTARFYPGYHDAVAPYGRWTTFQIVQAPQWVGTTNNFRYDYGFIVVARDPAGSPIEDVVGSLPIAFNQPRSQAYRLLGYPREPTPPYDGSQLWLCSTTYAGDYAAGAGPGPLQMSVNCDFGQGSSGGPWLTAQGAVVSVNSNSPTGQPNVEDGPYLDGDAAALYSTAGSISTAPPAPVALAKKKKCKKKRGHKRAWLAKKKCKRKHRHH